MNALGLSLILNMGCLCTKETIYINGNKYYIREKLGEGGFSTVFLAEKAQNKKKYAVKKIVCHGTEDQKTAIQEVEYHNALSHPNILPCLEYELTDNGTNPLIHGTTIVYMLLPYYPRGTLADELLKKEKSRTHFSTAYILNTFLQICEGVQVFHDFRPTPLAHHDLKPANILISHDSTPVIMDLGSACPAIVRVVNGTEAQRIQDFASERCTMPYRAPELFNVESNTVIDQRTDIWSLGCLLYALCYYKSPFDYVYERGDSVALATVSGNITFPDNSYPQEMNNLILYILKVNPAERPFIRDVIKKVEDIRDTIDVVC